MQKLHVEVRDLPSPPHGAAQMPLRLLIKDSGPLNALNRARFN
jgi:hypothetical protein